MKRIAVVAATGLFTITACTDGTGPHSAADRQGLALSQGSSGTVWVTTNANAGPGSFRQAILDANGDPGIHAVRFEINLGTIALQQPVTFSGPQSLTIDANGAVLHGGALGASVGAFIASGGGDLTIRDLTVRNAPGVGITVAVPNAATGTVTVSLDRIAARNNGSHGVLINDQAEYFNDPDSESPDGSAASLVVRVSASHFVDNGFTALDRDGLRINEGGGGTLDASIVGTTVVGNGGDGVELDERAAGDVSFIVQHTELNDNGSFSAADFDDGIDVDEGGEGSVIGRLVQVKANGNFEQGVDLNENAAGDLRVVMTQVEGSGNAQEGIEFEEDDDVAGGGDIVAELLNVTTIGNGTSDGEEKGDAGLKLREKGVGNLTARIVGALSSHNEHAGILVREDAAGNLDAELVNVTTNDNGDGGVDDVDDDGIKIDENASGDVNVRIQQALSSNNDGAGVAAEGTGLLRIQSLTAIGNADGALGIEASIAVEEVPEP